MRTSQLLNTLFGITLAVLPAYSQQLVLEVQPVQLVREVVYNELQDHRNHGYWRYWIERRSPSGSSIEQQVETAQGPVTVLAFGEGHPLNSQALQQQKAKLDQLTSSPVEQARNLRQYRQDEDRIGRLLAFMPDAYLFDFDGIENGCYRLRFHPNPAYPAHSVEERVLHAMSGTIWIDARYKHLTRLDGRVESNVDFGFGLLGRLYKGGWFQLQRTRVGPADWKTEHLEVHMNIRALLVTNFARETSETRGGFTPVPAELTLTEAITMLEETPLSLPAPNSAIASAAIRLGR